MTTNTLDFINIGVVCEGQTETDFYDDNINGHLRVFLYQSNERDKYL